MKSTLNDETRYKLLSLLHESPEMTQRELAEKMGISLGKANYCIKALIDVGHIKLTNFVKSNNKLGYAYFLTPKGIKEKAKVTIRFLEIKKQQYDSIKEEIDDLKKQLSQ